MLLDCIREKAGCMPCQTGLGCMAELCKSHNWIGTDRRLVAGPFYVSHLCIWLFSWSSALIFHIYDRVSFRPSASSNKTCNNTPPSTFWRRISLKLLKNVIIIFLNTVLQLALSHYINNLF